MQAPVSGSKKPAIDGQLVILCAGDESLFKDAEVALSKMGKRSLYLGATGAGEIPRLKEWEFRSAGHGLHDLAMRRILPIQHLISLPPPFGPFRT